MLTVQFLWSSFDYVLFISFPGYSLSLDISVVY